MELYFPAVADSAELKEYYTQLKRRTQLVLASVTRGEDTDKAVAAIDEVLLNRIQPKNFAGRESAELKMRRGFEETCVLLLQHIPKNPKGMTVLEFYTTLDTIRQQNKKQKKLNAKYG